MTTHTLAETFSAYPSTAKLIDLLESKGIRSLGDLAEISEDTLRSWRGMGQGKIALIERILHDHGLHLK